MIEINRDPSSRELQVFGLLLAIFAVVVAAVLWLRFDAVWWSRLVLGVGAALVFLYFVIPPLRRPLYLGWMYAAFPIGWTLSHLLLALIYYLILTPIGLLLRIFGWDPMRRRRDSQALTYWEDREGPAPAERYFRQF